MSILSVEQRSQARLMEYEKTRACWSVPRLNFHRNRQFSSILRCGAKPSYRWMSSEQFSQYTTVARASQALASLNLDRDRFKSLDYLLIPYRNDVHHALLGFAPRQKFAFIVDSVGTRDGKTVIELAASIHKALLMRILFSQFAENETWPLFSQWSQQSADGGPNIAR
ncbi:hypothetical protein WAI453_003021 [Rhynchosporium graminicola]